MAHVMKTLLAAVGTHATVIELEGTTEELAAVEFSGHTSVSALFVGSMLVGGLEGLMGLHLSGRLVPRLREAGVLKGRQSPLPCGFSNASVGSVLASEVPSELFWRFLQ